MVFESGKMSLLPVATKSRGEVNDVYICRDLSSPGGILYTVIVIHRHEIVRSILEMFRLSGRTGEGVLIDDFSNLETVTKCADSISNFCLNNHFYLSLSVLDLFCQPMG